MAAMSILFADGEIAFGRRVGEYDPNVK